MPQKTAPLEYDSPMLFDKVARQFPDLSIILAHMGHPWGKDAITLIRKHPNVYANVAGLHDRPWQMYNFLRLAAEWGVLDKLLFGSDYPINSPSNTIAGLKRVNEILQGTNFPRVPEDEVNAIIHRDSLKILSLE